MIAIGEDAFARIYQLRINAARGKCRCNNLAGEQFAVGSHVISSTRRQFADGGNATEQFVERVKVDSQIAVKLGEQRGTQEFARRIVVAFAERTGKFERGFSISRPGSPSHAEQCVV